LPFAVILIEGYHAKISENKKASRYEGISRITIMVDIACVVLASGAACAGFVAYSMASVDSVSYCRRHCRGIYFAAQGNSVFSFPLP
jgi:hypothetical protein